MTCVDSTPYSRDKPLVLQSDVLANIRKQARPLFNFARSPEYTRILAKSVRDEQPTRNQVKQLSPAFIDQLVNEYKAGGSVYELQNRHGVHRSTVAKHLKHRGIALGVQPLSKSEIARAQELYEQRLSLNAIGRAMGRDPKTIKAVVKM
ncbi:helix-turn-helix domain-containing protein [Agreia sp. VKM Ac-1783]|uniref:helix-turn-helix domain-containing protein n=1 Tax=Agreia sp. VKM Ac-1783 TaxID=1938889 RepID=UPI001120F189|nr:helix-turn-helix domain-containing protein [Agreia sp. VKM Ac-1783]